jgi:hypothetical protein
MNKTCSKCKIEKEMYEFPKDRNCKTGYCSHCKSCKSLYREEKKEMLKITYKNYKENNKEKIKAYVEKNKEHLKEYNKEYREKNKETIKQKSKINYENNIEIRREKLRNYGLKNKEKRNKRIKNRKINDTLFKLNCSIRSSISNSIKRHGYKKYSKSFEILGCSFEEFKIYIESKFEQWMDWNNHGKYNGDFDYGWDLDHIIPSSSAESEGEIIKLNHYTNFQPLCSKINRDVKKNNIYQ